MSLFETMPTGPVFFNYYLFLWSTNYGRYGRYTTFYLPLLKIAWILLKNEVYNAGPITLGKEPSPPFFFFFLQKVHFVFFFLLFFRKRAILDLDFDFKPVLKPQQLLYFHPKTQAPLWAERHPESKVALLFYNHLSVQLPKDLKMIPKNKHIWLFKMFKF